MCLTFCLIFNTLILHIGSDGYCKLVDFGFAKEVPFINPKNGTLQYRTYTMCGTAEYMGKKFNAVEITLNTF